MLKEYQVLYLDNDIPINRSFYCNNGDIKSRGLEVHVLDNSQAKDCTGLTLKMIIKVPSGEMFEATVANGLVTVLNVTGGIYQILFPNNMGKGRLIAEIQLSNTVPEIIVSRKFSILGDGSLTSDGSINPLPGAGLLYPIIQAEPERVAAESLRKIDEAARKTAETTRAGFYNGFDASLAAKANKVQEPWITPTFLNGTTPYAGSSPAFYKDNFGVVRCKGRIVCSSGVTTYQLPPGYRPQEQLAFVLPTLSNTVFLRATVDITGDVKIYGTITTYVDISAINFKAV